MSNPSTWLFKDICPCNNHDFSHAYLHTQTLDCQYCQLGTTSIFIGSINLLMWMMCCLRCILVSRCYYRSVGRTSISILCNFCVFTVQHCIFLSQQQNVQQKKPKSCLQDYYGGANACKHRRKGLQSGNHL